MGARVSDINPIANHAGWQGKIFKIVGFDKDYGNLKTNTGYPDDIQGLGGVNCKHRIFPFWVGISSPNPIQYDEEENRRICRLQQIQRAKERKIRQLQKQLVVAETIQDKEMITTLKKKLRSRRKDIADWCEANGRKRDYAREQIVKPS